MYRSASLVAALAIFAASLCSAEAQVIYSFTGATTIPPTTTTFCPNNFVGVCCKHIVKGRYFYDEVPNGCHCNRLGGQALPLTACQPRPPCMCSPELSPVCCRRQGVKSTASNECACICDFGQVVQPYAGCGLAPL
jgi:hypothetical protein